MTFEQDKAKRGQYRVADNTTAIWSFLHITIYHKITAVFTAVLFLFNIISTDIAWALKAEFTASDAALSIGDKEAIKKEKRNWAQLMMNEFQYQKLI